MPRHKKKNQQLFDKQNGLCALCKQPIPHGPNQMCLFEPKNVVVCRTCNTLIHNHIRLKQPGGVTLADVEAFLIEQPEQEPQAKSEHRRLVESGRLQYDGFEIVGGVWVDRFTGEPADPDRPFKDWEEALRCHPEWAEKTE